MRYENQFNEIIAGGYQICTLDYPKLILEDDSKLINKKYKNRCKLNLRRD